MLELLKFGQFVEKNQLAEFVNKTLKMGFPANYKRSQVSSVLITVFVNMLAFTTKNFKKICVLSNAPRALDMCI